MGKGDNVRCRLRVFLYLFLSLSAVAEHNFDVIVLVRMFCNEVIDHRLGHFQDILIRPYLQADIFAVTCGGPSFLLLTSASCEQSACHQGCHSKCKNPFCFHNTVLLSLWGAPFRLSPV